MGHSWCSLFVRVRQNDLCDLFFGWIRPVFENDRIRLKMCCTCSSRVVARPAQKNIWNPLIPESKMLNSFRFDVSYRICGTPRFLPVNINIQIFITSLHTFPMMLVRRIWRSVIQILMLTILVWGLKGFRFSQLPLGLKLQYLSVISKIWED